MNFTKHITGVVVTAVGVVAAGFIMNMLRDIPFINQARNGFDV